MNPVVYSLSNKLHLKEGDYFAYVGTGEGKWLFPEMLNSVRSAVIGEQNRKVRGILQKNDNMRNVRFVYSLKEMDESAFDKVLYMYSQNSSEPEKEMKETLKSLVRVSDNMGLILIANIPLNTRERSNGVFRYDVKLFEDWLDNKGIYNRWFLRHSDDSDVCDILIKVRKLEE